MSRKKTETEKMLWDGDIIKTRFRRGKKRAIILCTIVIFCFSVISLRLVVLMVFDHEMLSKKAERQYRSIKTLKPYRGLIWDRKLRQMAVNIEADSLYAVPSRIHDVERLSSHIAPLVKTSAKRLGEKILARKDKEFMWVSRKMDEETALNVSRLKAELKLHELGLLTETKRYYPKGQIAAHIIGYTNIDNEGLSGIELRYNDFLKGKLKKVELSRDARGYNLSEGIEDNIPGNNLLLTIDEGLQYIVEREIEDAMKTWEAEAVVAVMMSPLTGEIIAMANKPTYNPNSPGRSNADKRRNRAVTDIYEPGSTFKTFPASAAIEEGVVTLYEPFDVSKGFIKVPGGYIRDSHKEEILTFKEIIQKSSNVGAVEVGLRLGKERFYRYIKRFGFGEKTGIDLPGEVRGILRNTRDWSGRSLASLSIGQEIAVTSLQILRAYSVIANGGKLMRPYIVSEIISPQGKIIKKFFPKVERRVISENTARIMRDVLKTVVEEGGTAQGASIQGNLVAGKTGTAQMIDPETGRYSKSDYISSFVGFVPANNPKIALIVVVYKPEGARYGGVVAAPVFKKIIEHSLVYLNIPMEKEENHVVLASGRH